MLDTIFLYITGAFMTYTWWDECRSFNDRNWQGLLVVIFWPVVALAGMYFRFMEWLEI